MDIPRSAGWPWVWAQFGILVIAAAEPFLTRVLHWRWVWADRSGGEVVAAVVLIASAIGLGVWAARALGTHLTVVPRPREDSVLVETGPYRWVRHPLYSALLLALTGWALAWRDLGLVVLVLTLLLVLSGKIRFEERWLTSRYPEYQSYRRRTGALWPRWPSRGES